MGDVDNKFWTDHRKVVEMLHVEKRCVTVRTSNPSDGEALRELLDLTGPVSGIYLQILKELLKKHHNNVTYARNMFFRSLFLQTRLGKIPFRMSELYGKSQRKVVSVSNPMLKQTNGVENKGNYMSWLELNLIANIATYLPLEDFFSFILKFQLDYREWQVESVQINCGDSFANHFLIILSSNVMLLKR